MIITELGFTAAHAQILTVPPYIIAMPLSMYASVISDRHSIRGPFPLFFSAIGITGFAILFSTSRPWVGYAGSVIGAIGAVGPVPIVLAWAGNNCAGDLKRGEFTVYLLSTGLIMHMSLISAVGLAIVLGGSNVFG